MSSNGSNGSEGWSQGRHGQSWYTSAKKKHASEVSALNGTASQGRLVTKEQQEIQEPERLRATSAPAPRAAPERPSRPRAPEGGGAAALLVEAEHKARGRQRPDRPQPSLVEVQEAAATVQSAQSALLTMETGDNGHRAQEKEHKEARKRLAQAYQKALRRCAFCPGKELDALKWLEDFEDFGEASRTEKADDLSLTYPQRHEDHPEWRPDVPDYLAALQVCEDTQQPLERVWTLLLDLRKKGLDLDSSRDRDQKEIEGVRQKLAKKEHKPNEVDETFEELERQLKDAQEAVAYAEYLASPDASSALRQHAERWLLPEAAHPRAVAAVLRLGSLLQRTDGSRADLDAVVRRLGVLPILEAFNENPQRLTLVQDLGLFTPEALRSLGIHTIGENGSESAWRKEAARAVHRQAMLRRWSSWNEAEGPGSFAWLAYDLSSQSEQFRCDGEVVGRAPKSPTVSEELFPSLEQDKRPDHAERRALMLLAEKLLQGFSDGGCDCIEVRGVLMLYTPFPPETTSIFAMLQFLQLFPWVEMHVAYDDAVDLSSPGAVERIRCEHQELKVEALNGIHGKS